MPPVVIDVRNAEDRREVVHRAVQALINGQIVALPTETVYGLAANALDSEAVSRLVELKGRGPDRPLTLAVGSAAEARDYAPGMSPLAQRLARRCWPGPVTLVVDDAHPDSMVNRLPPQVLQAVSPRGTVGLRVPGHPAVLDVLGMMTGPLTLSSANLSGQPDAVNAQQVVESLGEDLDLVLDDGPCQFGQPSSVVLVQGNSYEILRPGVVAEKTLKRLSSMMVLLVCTGNTCRSPMAEVLCRSMVARRMNCEIDELEERGVIVLSAGVAAMMGGRASAESVRVISEMGLDLRDHYTQPLTELLVRHADNIYTMTGSHREAIVAQWPDAAERTRLLSADGREIADPIGGSLERYQHCADEIISGLTSRLDELEL